VCAYFHFCFNVTHSLNSKLYTERCSLYSYSVHSLHDVYMLCVCNRYVCCVLWLCCVRVLCTHRSPPKLFILENIWLDGIEENVVDEVLKIANLEKSDIFTV
jgi:hypothetical protein